MIWFLLWREYKLSIAEILCIFPEARVIYSDKSVAILESTFEEVTDDAVINRASKLWGTIKIIKLQKLENNSFQEKLIDIAWEHDWKFQYWLSQYWKKTDLKKILLWLKKELKANWLSSRFVNKDFKNLSSAQIIWEKLIKKWTDFSCIITEGSTYFWHSIWVQDIEAYSKRDYSKSRDMQVGMLPPKLSQMMINLSWGQNTSSIYDPFVWLGTILIEAENMWFTNLYWSDLSETMVETSKENLSKIIPSSQKYTTCKIEKLNAKFIHEASFWQEVKDWIIVTEWFLGEVMTKKNISKERIQVQRDTLTKLYKAFFENLSKWWFTWTIVMSFPFWEMRWKYFYFDEIYSILEEYCEIHSFFPEDFSEQASKLWSLLYKREKQLVWREIFSFKIL